MRSTGTHPSQTFLPLFTELEILTSQQEFERREARRQARQAKYVTKAVPIVADLNLLDLPLFRSSGEILDLLTGDPFTDDSINALASESEDESEVAETWSDEAAAKLHCVLLDRSLEYLAANGNQKEKNDVLNWIFRPETVEEVYRFEDGKKIRILIPFTFGACCRLNGYDPEELRDRIEMQLEEAGIPIQ